MRFSPAGFLISIALAALAGCAPPPPLAVVPHVDVAQYMGRWYEIARYPASFQEGCTATTAEYELRSDGKVDVVNRCKQGSVDGPLREARAVARVVDPQTNAKLKVMFTWPFEGDYWILELGPAYDWAVVGEPSRNYLWILSRTPRLAPEVYEGILERLPEKGYDPARLLVTEQPAK